MIDVKVYARVMRRDMIEVMGQRRRRYLDLVKIYYDKAEESRRWYNTHKESFAKAGVYFNRDGWSESWFAYVKRAQDYSVMAQACDNVLYELISLQDREG